MSVSLFRKTEINSLMRTYAQNDDESRAIWYAYVSNVTAFNLQYRENETIDFDFEKYENIQKWTLGSLHYNIATNDGNHFMQDKWHKIFTNIIKRVNKLDEYEQEHLIKRANKLDEYEQEHLAETYNVVNEKEI
tara:strand:- start:1228 stop:1629 length:402 start_codon:yes stop_codon:yes gene_type:complete